MITILRAFGLALLTALPLIAAAPAHAAAAPTAMSLSEGVQALPVAVEHREGYVRSKFKHWVDADKDSCNTRAEVLIDESLTTPVVEAGCKVVSGTWFSYYDEQNVTDPRQLDIDHMSPLAEAWDSGASAWTPARREAYANDLDAERSLVAVTAKTNRSKGDQDPADWMPPAPDARCLYLSDWVSTKLRWGLSADQREVDALTRLAGDCGGTEVSFTPAS